MLVQALAKVMYLGLNCSVLMGPECFPSRTAMFIPLSVLHMWILPSSEPGLGTGHLSDQLDFGNHQFMKANMNSRRDFCRDWYYCVDSCSQRWGCYQFQIEVDCKDLGTVCLSLLCCRGVCQCSVLTNHDKLRVWGEASLEGDPLSVVVALQEDKQIGGKKRLYFL